MKITPMLLLILFALTLLLTIVGFGAKIGALLCGIATMALGMLYYLDSGRREEREKRGGQ